MKVIINKEKINTLLSRAVSATVIKEHLEETLNSGRVLRVKFGIDPTAPDIHLGHTVPLLKLRQFQDLGHQAVLIIGDFTARIGDPTGRVEARKLLSEAEVKKNMKSYLKQVGKILDVKKTEVHYNTEWFNKMKAKEFYELAGKVTVQQVLKREDFKKRIASDIDITTNEIMYPLFQGYDSVMVKSDIEIGGEDQLLNLLMGRRIQRAYGASEQDILTLWLIEGIDGKRKMSKSYDNYISTTEKPHIMYGKIMAIPDTLVVKYFRALTNVPEPEIKLFESDMKQGKLHPRNLKSNLAYEIVKIYYGNKKAKQAEEEFESVFRKHKLPEDIQEIPITIKDCNVVELLINLGLASSKSQARRLVLENAVRVSSDVIKDPLAIIRVSEGMVVRSGKRNFRKIVKK